MESSLLLSEQRREKDALANALTVVHIGAVDRGRECPLARVGCIYAKKFQKLLRLAGHERLEQDGGDAQGFSHVKQDPFRIGGFPRLCCMEVFVGLMNVKKMGSAIVVRGGS